MWLCRTALYFYKFESWISILHKLGANNLIIRGQYANHWEKKLESYFEHHAYSTKESFWTLTYVRADNPNALHISARGPLLGAFPGVCPQRISFGAPLPYEASILVDEASMAVVEGSKSSTRAFEGSAGLWMVKVEITRMTLTCLYCYLRYEINISGPYDQSRGINLIKSS